MGRHGSGQTNQERGTVVMLSKRLIACLDVREGKLAKSVRFVDTLDIGDPVEKALQYYRDGIDELVFYDITASRENRDISIEFVEKVAAQIFIPFSVGGGILSMDVRRVNISREIPSGFEIVINDGATPTGIDALEWARQGEELGAGELVVNSIDADGTKEGYELKLTRLVADSVGIPVIASGGAGEPGHLYRVFTEGHADGAIVASIVHYGEYTCRQLKEYLHYRDIKVRMNY